MLLCIITSTSGGSTSESLTSGGQYYNYYDDDYGCYGSFYGDGYCDSNLNDADCGYDGGDCCICECVDGSTYPCGYNSFSCLDPFAETDCAAAASPTPSPTPFSSLIPPTSSTPTSDPTTPPSSPTPPTSPTPSSDSDCVGQAASAGDGYCDDSNNSLACDWDGGDCCACTCVDADFYCAPFDCLDPGAPTDCEAESSADSSSQSAVSSAGDRTADTDTDFSSLEVSGIVIASFTGYCLFGGLLTLAGTSILRKHREKKQCEKNTAAAAAQQVVV